jgi:hypothetical protein
MIVVGSLAPGIEPKAGEVDGLVLAEDPAFPLCNVESGFSLMANTIRDGSEDFSM